MNLAMASDATFVATGLTADPRPTGWHCFACWKDDWMLDALLQVVSRWACGLTSERLIPCSRAASVHDKDNEGDSRCDMHLRPADAAYGGEECSPTAGCTARGLQCINEGRKCGRWRNAHMDLTVPEDAQIMHRD